MEDRVLIKENWREISSVSEQEHCRSHSRATPSKKSHATGSAETMALVFMLFVSLRFPSTLSLFQVIRNRYGDTIVKLVRKFEKVDFKHSKAAIDLNFLQTFRSFNVVQKFLQFRVANKISEDHKLTESAEIIYC